MARMILGLRSRAATLSRTVSSHLTDHEGIPVRDEHGKYYRSKLTPDDGDRAMSGRPQIDERFPSAVSRQRRRPAEWL